MQADEPGVAVIPNSNYFPGRNGLRPQWIIVHGTAGGTSAEAIARYFSSTQGTANPVSSHYIVGQDGEIVQCVSEGDGAWANGVLTAGHDGWWSEAINPNNQTISIEHVKTSTDNSDQLTPAQEAASLTLISHICQRWHIPMRAADADGGITGHFSLDPINRHNCPGSYPWDKIQEGASMISNSGTYGPQSADFKQWFEVDSNGNWIVTHDGPCKGNILMGANRDLVGQLSYDGQSLPITGLPLENEQYHTEQDGYKWSSQRCERAVINYDPAKRFDNPPGIPGSSYIAHMPAPETIEKTVTVNVIPDQIKADIKNVIDQITQLGKDAGL